jgi:predicted nuclease with TOPRIM domain
LNNKLDKLLSLTQKERVDTNVSKIEADKHVRQIEQLKVSEARVKEQMKKLSKESTAYLKEIHDNQKKLAEANERIEILNGIFVVLTL